jgi:trehalose 6-phosphate synthase
MQYYDVLLVNPIIDGMNLVAKEGPVVNQRNGLLVLSRTVGAFHQLEKFCIPTSPTHTSETAQALYKALTMPAEEKRIKAVLARQAVENQDLNGWLAKQIQDLNEVLDSTSPRPTRIEMSLDPLEAYEVLAAAAG